MTLPTNEIEGILESRKQSARAYVEEEVLTVRKKARDYYEGKPFGNEVDGRSQFILTDVRDKIEALMPALMKVFTSGRLCDFLPVSPEDEKQAREATIAVNHTIMKQNRGFSVLETAFKDGLLEKVGITKAWVEEVDTTKTESRTGLLIDAVNQLESDPKVEILEEDEREITIGGEILTVFDVRIRIEGETRYNIRVGNVVPENFFIDPSTTYVRDANYVGERMEKTVSELIEMGVDRNLAEAQPQVDISGQTAITSMRRRTPAPSQSDDASKMVAVWWEHATIDIDEDGIAERYRFLRSDSGDMLLDPEEWGDEWPYQAGSPIPKPHEFYGTSLAEEIMDIQLAKSTIFREWLDNIYSSNNQRVKVYESIPGQVSMDDVLNQDLRAPIRIRSAPGGQADVQPLGNSPLGEIVFPALEFLDQVAEVRSGVSKMGQGLDPNVLHKTPATTAGFMMSLAQEKQALIARVYAETLVTDLCMAVYRLMRRYDDAPRTLRLTNGFVAVAPGTWPENMDVTVNVGLGTGNKMQQAQNLQQLSGYMQQGARMGLVSPDNVYNAAKTAVEVLGFVNPDLYFTDPLSPKGQELKQRQQQQQGQPDPVAMMALQIEKEKNDAKNQIDKGKLVLEQMKVMEELGIEKSEVQAKLQLKAQELIQNAQLKLLEIQTEAELEGMELGMEQSLKREELAIEERLGGKKIAFDANIKDPDS